MRSAFDHMPRQRATSQLVEIIGPPAKFMDQRAECQRAIYDASGDDDICPLRYRMRNRESAKIGIGAGDALLRKGVASKHVARIDKARQPVHQAVAFYSSDLQIQPQLGNFAAQQFCQTSRVHGTRIADSLRTCLRNLRQKWPDMHIHKVQRKAAVRIGQPHPPHHPHRALSQIVEDDIIHPRTQQLRYSQRAVDEKGGAATDADDLIRNHIGSSG